MKKCPICGTEFTDLSRHLVLAHNIRDINHLRTLTQKRVNFDNETNTTLNTIQQKTEKEPNINLRKQLLKTALKIQGEPIIRTRVQLIKKLGRITNQFMQESALLNEGIEVLLFCLKDPNQKIKETTIKELENILKYEKLDEEIKTKIQKRLSTIF